MSLPKKGRRNITVGNSDYHWMASGNDGYIVVYVEKAEVKGQRLSARFKYHSAYQPPRDWGDRYFRQRMKVTPGIVRQVIELGLEQGWKPEEKGLTKNLGFLDTVIDLNLEE